MNFMSRKCADHFFNLLIADIHIAQVSQDIVEISLLDRASIVLVIASEQIDHLNLVMLAYFGLLFLS